MKTLQGALFGFGFIAERGHAPAYASRASRLRIVAVAEPCVARHSAIKAALPDARIYLDHGELLSREPLDFIDICAPPSEHMQLAIDAFATGLHVLCEKPLAVTPAEAMLMSRAATRAERVLFPAHSYRHAPVIRSLRDLLTDDAIGRVHMVTLDTYRTTHARGVQEWRPDWRREPRYAGSGILMDHGPHTSYLAFEWLGGYPTSVSAWSRSVSGDDVEDDATMTMVFPTGVARAHLSWNAGFRRVIYTLHGSHGAIRVEDDDVEVVQRHTDGTVRSERRSLPSDWRDAGHGPWFEGVLRAFSTAIERRDWVGAEARDAIVGLEVISAALSSARDDGAPITLPTRLGPLALERSA